MRTFKIIALTILMLIQAGCAAGLHVGGERTGLGVSGAVLHDPIVEAPPK